MSDRVYTLEDVEALSIPEPNTGCWLLLCGTANSFGYGKWGVGVRKQRYAHRLAYVAAYGPIPPGMVVCHKCDVSACVNPDHLFAASQGDNIRDCVAKGRHKPPPPRSGEAHHQAKITQSDAEAIRRDKRPSRVVGPEYGISHAMVCYIRRGTNWRAA